MVDRGLEVIIGMNRDRQFGPMLMFGLGGIFVEVMKDVTFHLAPITQDEAIQMLKATRSYEICRANAVSAAWTWRALPTACSASASSPPTSRRSPSWTSIPSSLASMARAPCGRRQNNLEALGKTTMLTFDTFDPDWQEKYRDMIATRGLPSPGSGPASASLSAPPVPSPWNWSGNSPAGHANWRRRDRPTLTRARRPMHGKAGPCFLVNSFFIGTRVRGHIQEGFGQYTPVLLSDIPRLFSSGQLPLDVVLIQVSRRTCAAR